VGTNLLQAHCEGDQKEESHDFGAGHDFKER
jgi:hypothetical protein